MKRNLVAAVAALLALGSSASQANSTFDFTAQVAGSYQYFNGASAVPGGCDQYLGTGNYDGCIEAGIVPVSGIAALTVTTASNADGTYTGDSLDQIAYTGPYASFVFNAGDTPVYNEPGDGYPFPIFGAVPGASVTITDGVVSAIDVTYYFSFSQVVIDGLRISDFGATGSHAASGWSLAGTAVSAIPEPINAALLLAGLLLLAGVSRRQFD